MSQKILERLEDEILKLEKERDEKMQFLINGAITLARARTNYGNPLGAPGNTTFSDIALEIDSLNDSIDGLRQKVISQEIKSLLTSSERLESLTRRLDILTIVLIIATIFIAGASFLNLFHI